MIPSASLFKRSSKKPRSRSMLRAPLPSLELRRGLQNILSSSIRPNVPARKAKPMTLSVIQRSPPSKAKVPLMSSAVFRATALKNLKFALDNSYTGDTSKNQEYAVKRFIRFAVKCGVVEDEALPCSADMLCMWIADGVGRTGVGTASANIAALAAWHRSRDLPFEVPLKIKTIKRAIKLHWPEEKQQKPTRPPISPRMIRLLAKAWESGCPRQKCALAVATAAYMGQMRLGELLPVSPEKLIRERLPSRARWTLRKESPGASSVFLPWTKTTGKAGALITLPPQSYPLDPTTAICVHLVASPLSDSALLCEFVERGRVHMLDKEVFMLMCNEVWNSNGFPRITGHLFRIGGTTALLLAGIDMQIVKGMGRWSSDAFKRYWRKVEVLFNKHAAEVKWVDFDI